MHALAHQTPRSGELSANEAKVGASIQRQPEPSVTSGKSRTVRATETR